jgi:hypothetical protein
MRYSDVYSKLSFAAEGGKILFTQPGTASGLFTQPHNFLAAQAAKKFYLNAFQI